jgi:hypothetical protein
MSRPTDAEHRGNPRPPRNWPAAAAILVCFGVVVFALTRPPDDADGDALGPNVRQVQLEGTGVSSFHLSLYVSADGTVRMIQSGGWRMYISNGRVVVPASLVGVSGRDYIAVPLASLDAAWRTVSTLDFGVDFALEMRDVRRAGVREEQILTLFADPDVLDGNVIELVGWGVYAHTNTFRIRTIASESSSPLVVPNAAPLDRLDPAEQSTVVSTMNALAERLAA